jgi:cytosine/adenosine deaminase-related metal-dependent hydrolase
LSTRRRAVLCTEAASCGEFLCDAVNRGGAQALTYPGGVIAVGKRADFLTLIDRSGGELTPGQLLDRAVFCDPAAAETAVVIGGVPVR